MWHSSRERFSKNPLFTGFVTLCMLLSVGLIVFLSVQIHQSQQQTAALKQQTPTYAATTYNVGYRVNTVKYTVPDTTANTKTLTYAVWYPTIAQESLYNYNRVIAPPGMVAINAPLYKDPTVGAYPLIILSPGSLGCGTIYVYLTSYLAAHGYIVAAYDPEDATICTIDNESIPPVPAWCTSTKATDPNSTCDRPYDMSEVITDMLDRNNDVTSPFHNSINISEIAVTGHSAGGLTAMQVSGLEPALKDNRIKAASLLAEDTGTYPASAYTQMGIPTIFQFGQDDETARATSVSRIVPYTDTQSPKYINIFQNTYHLGQLNELADHLALDDTVCNGQPTIDACQTSINTVKTVLNYSQAFFDYYLKGNRLAGKYLTRDIPNPPYASLVCHMSELPGEQQVGGPCP